MNKVDEPRLLLGIILLLVMGCGESRNTHALAPAEPIPTQEAETVDPEESASEPAPEPEVEPETEPEPEPILVWTAPEGEELECENFQVPYTFNPAENGYDLSNAFWTMWFAKRSFTGGEETTRQELLNLGFTDYEYIENEAAGLQVLLPPTTKARSLPTRVPNKSSTGSQIFTSSKPTQASMSRAKCTKGFPES